MLPDFVQYFLFIGVAAMMFLLRVDARRFSAAEWDTQDGEWRVWMGRLTWYAAGVAFALIIFALHPSPVADLNLVLSPDRGEAMVYGLLFGGAGIVAAFVLAIIRNGRISFPAPSHYPGGVLTAVGTAFLGLLLSLGLPDWLAIVSAAFIYAFAVRAGTGSRGIFTLALWLAIGLIAGALTVSTLGIAAGFLGHAITRFALFMTMGPPARAVVAEVHRPSGGSGDDGAYLIPPREARRG
jgi:hypothetical protein